MLLEKLTAALADHPHVGDVRGKGLMCAVEFVQDKTTREEFDPAEQAGQRVHAAAQRRGLFSRLRGDVFLMAPPIVISTDQINHLVEALTESIKEILG